MRCPRVQEHLILYMAGELTPQENSQMRDHLAGCADCSALAEDLAATQERVSAAMRTDHEPPVTLDTRVMAAIRALPVQERWWTRFLPNWRAHPGYAWSAAVGCLVILGMFIAGYRRERSALELTNLGAAHNRFIAAAAPSEFQGSDPQQLTQQIMALVTFPVQAADLKSEGALLVGGRRIIVDNVAVAALHYNWEGHPISLFEMDSSRRTPSQLRQLEREPDSYYVHKAGEMAYVAWHSGKTDCVMVARSVPMHMLFHLACRACERQEKSQERTNTKLKRVQVLPIALSTTKQKYEFTFVRTNLWLQ